MVKRGLVALVVILLSAAAHGSWTTHGPVGGNVRSLAIAPSDRQVIYAAAADGVFRTTVGSGTWSDVSGPIVRASEIDVSGSDSNVVLVAASNGVFRSDDGGATWQSAIGIPKFAVITRLIIDPVHPNIIYASVGWYDGPGVYKSIDGGRTFFDSSGSLIGGQRFVQSLALDPVSPNHLYLSYLYQGDVFGYATSRDAGATWSVTPWRSPDVPTGMIIASPKQGTRRYGTGAGVFTSDDGVNWTVHDAKELGTSGYVAPQSLSIDPAVPRLFTATARGAYRSGDGGRTWLPLDREGRDPVNDIDFDPRTGAVVIGTDAGVFRSVGFPWNAWMDLRLQNMAMVIDKVVADPTNGDVYALSGRRLFRSRDRGKSWQSTGPRLPRSIAFEHELIVDAGHNVYVLYRDFSDWSLSRLRADQTAWDEVRRLQPFDNPVVVAHPRVPGMLYIAELESIVRSSDGGATWSERKTPHAALSVYVDTDDPELLLSIATDGSGHLLLRSVDGGRNWTTIKLTEEFWRILSLTGAPSDPNVIYMLAYDIPDPYLARSDDRGLTWTPLSIKQLESLAPGDAEMQAIAVDRHNPNIVYLSTTGAGIFRSVDGARTWASISEGLPERHRLSIAVDAAGEYLHAGTRTRGVWEMPLKNRRRASGD